MARRNAFGRPLIWAGAALLAVAAAGQLLPDPAAVQAAPAAARIEINLSAYRLTLYQGDAAVASYRVAIGAPNRRAGGALRVTATPTGRFWIGKKTKNPSWIPPSWWIREEGWSETFFVPPGPANPLGLRWLGLSRPGYSGYGIHGTADEASIGRAVSLGCVRMRNADVVDLFDRVAVGTPVDIVDRTVEVVRGPDGGALLALYPSVYGRGRAAVADVRAALRSAGLPEELGDDAFWKAELAAAAGGPVYVALGRPADALRPPVPGPVIAAALPSAHPDEVSVSIALTPLGQAERRGDDYLLPLERLPDAFRAHFDVDASGVVRFYGEPLPGAELRAGEAWIPVRDMAHRLHMTERWLDAASLDLSW
ncbi:MAG: L,D-transpeptidase [Firmicutes bacterium]|nr:L,D-transpeptidase [Bacillota bacterium]